MRSPTPISRIQYALFRLGQWQLGHRGGPENDITPGLAVVGKDAGQHHVRLWIGTLRHGSDAETLDATVTVRGQAGDAQVTTTLLRYGFDDERPISGWKPGTRFFHGHVLVDGLAPDATGTATVELAAGPGGDAPLRASCRIRTLPARIEVGSSFTALVGSCYDADTDDTDEFDAAFTHLRDEVAAPDLSLLVGDQVYADAPALFYALMARRTPRTYALLEYWTSWGMQAGRRGMRTMLAHGPHWFLPDDHEFWNNWPHASVTAKHSYSNIVKAAVGGLRRWAARLGRRPGAEIPAPADPGPPPTDPLVQSYHPVHPDEWDAWSRAAFDLYGSFQTPSVHEYETGRITRGQLDDDDPRRPPRDGPRGEVHRPLNRLVQRIDLGAVQVAMLDTRTRRVRRTDDPRYSAFVDDEYLHEVLAVAAEAPILVLVTPQPLLDPPGWRRKADAPLRYRLKRPADTRTSDYTYRYGWFWDELVRARDGRPTITVGGDIHSSYLGYAPSVPLLEVVSSPMSLVAGATLPDRLLALPRLLTGRGPHDEYAAGTVLASVEDLCSTGPRDRSPEDHTAVSLASLGAGNPEGLGLLEFSRPDEHRFVVTASLHLRASLARGSTDGRQQVTAELFTDRRGPEALRVLGDPRRA
ncbi:alkaline phosphatase D family protein [Pseudonocardia phyllosphaerae]|uniref:alkaline phosphatase D family protein n=1 Tax=Pseudonocardia phyllosphaerae TaxID=3390502 RepID=UPI00397DBDFD